MAYRHLAYVYDHLMSDAPYGRWVQFTKDLIGKRSVRRIVDLGCGTGEITIKLAKEGYDMIGIDYSSDMLAFAEQKAFEEKVNIQWIHQDLRKLEGLEDLDVCISYCDVMNYITDEKEIGDVFRNVYASLKNNGMFIFDIHAIDNINENYINQTFADVTEDVSYIWFCTEGDYPGEMYHELTFFVKNGTKYQRFDEIHHQRTYPVHIYQCLLEEAGFKNITMYHDFSLSEQGKHQGARVFFCAEK